MAVPIQIRASSLGELFDCPARWQAKHLIGLRLPISAASRLGTAVHAGTALFDQSRLDGNPLTADEAAGAVADVIQDKNEDVDWIEVSQKDAEKIAIPLHGLYCEKIAPKQNYVAVEALCDNLTITDIGITLTGTVDRVRITDDGLGIADLKTGKTAVAADGTVKTLGHAAQIGVYELLASHALAQDITAPAQIIGFQTGKTAKGQRVGTGEIYQAKDVLLDGEDGTPGLLRHASKIVHSGDFYGNPRSPLCAEK
ncbi:MAG: PD-(D/E)XK nuclease family protein [Desulfovibrio sp.]|nr:PD-(D/E)XK nuclease family protein [Desulfovibrio sp.]